MEDKLGASSTQRVNTGVAETTYYVYAHNGDRVRKVTERQAAHSMMATKSGEIIYLGGLKLQLKFASDGKTQTSRRTFNSVTRSELVAVIETTDENEEKLVRYQVGDNLELDDDGKLVSYEELSPFGAVMYSACRRGVEAPRIYRFADYEHDHETGLCYCDARYYCPWLGRWTSPDPLGYIDGPNALHYSHNDPVNNSDPQGTSTGPRYMQQSTSSLLKIREISNSSKSQPRNKSASKINGTPRQSASSSFLGPDRSSSVSKVPPFRSMAGVIPKGDLKSNLLPDKTPSKYHLPTVAKYNKDYTPVVKQRVGSNIMSKNQGLYGMTGPGTQTLYKKMAGQLESGKKYHQDAETSRDKSVDSIRELNDMLQSVKNAHHNDDKFQSLKNTVSKGVETMNNKLPSLSPAQQQALVLKTVNNIAGEAQGLNGHITGYTDPRGKYMTRHEENIDISEPFNNMLDHSLDSQRSYDQAQRAEFQANRGYSYLNSGPHKPVGEKVPGYARTRGRSPTKK